MLQGGIRLKNFENKDPLFSLVTVVKNNEKFIDETINSVLNQTFKDFEYIIVDGDSKDNTLSIIKKYENKIDYWVSQKDNGIYDAFNYGISLCKGRYIGIINSDDIYTKDALKIISRYIDLYPENDFIFGSVKKHWGILHGFRPNKIYYSWGFYTSHSTGFFIKKESAKKIGPYNIKYKFHADYDYFYRMIVKNKMIGIATKKDEVTGIFRRGGFSSTISFFESSKEESKIRIDNGQNRLFVLFIFFYKLFKHILKSLFQ